MCNLAPDGKKCVYGDGTQLYICCVHRLTAAWTELKRNIPLFGANIKPYHCLQFEEEE